DGNSSQWVPADVSVAQQATAPGDFLATSTAATPAATQTIIFPTVVTGNSGSWYNVANGRFTPPAGRYRISACLGRSMSTGSPGSQQCVLRKNGTALVTGTGTVAGNFFWAQAIVDGEYDANGTDWFDIQCGGTAWDRTPALSWFTAQAVGVISYTTPAPGNLYLYSEQVVTTPTNIMAVTFPSNAKAVEIRMRTQQSAVADAALWFNGRQGGTVINTGVYSFQRLYSSGATPNADITT